MRSIAVLMVAALVRTGPGCANSPKSGSAAAKGGKTAAANQKPGYFETRKNGATYVFNSPEVIQRWKKNPSGVKLADPEKGLTKENDPVYFQNDIYATYNVLQEEFRSRHK